MGDFGKFCKKDENIQLVHTPAVAADSASTSLIKIGTLPNLYITPRDRTDLQNIFARALYGVRLTPTKFNDLNPFGFTYDILRGGGLMSSSSFGKGTATQGPSLDYLMELFLHAYNDPTGANYEGFKRIIPHGCLNISKDFTPAAYKQVCADIRDKVPVFPAFKQEGDGRQFSEMGDVADALAAAGIVGFLLFVSQDRQAVALAIAEIFKEENKDKKLVVVQHQPGGALTVTRNDAGMDPDALEAYNAKRLENYIMDNVTLLEGFATLAEKIATFMSGEGVALPAIQDPAIQRLYTLKVADIREQLIAISTMLVGGGVAAAAELVARIRTLIAEIRSMPEPRVGINERLEEIERAIKAIYARCESVNISVSLLSSLHALVPGPFDPRKNYSFLGYSPDDFVEIDKIFRTEKQTTAGAIGKVPRVQFDPLDILYRKNGFFEKISYITNSFFNPNTMTDVKSTFTLEATSAIVADIKLKQQAIITYTDMETAYKEMTEVQRRDIRDAMGAARNEAISATIYLRNLEHAYFQRLSSAEEGDDALGGGAYTQHGGALGESHFEALEEIAVEAAIFINSYFIDNSDGVLNEEPGPVRNYTINRIPDTPANNARKVAIFKHVLDMIPRSAAVTKANELLAKLKVAIADMAELSETDLIWIFHQSVEMLIFLNIVMLLLKNF
jgi:hypothetical protein